MLTPFPELLTYSYFAPTLLRLTAAVIFLLLTYHHYRQVEEGNGHFMRYALMTLEAIVGLGLVLGFLTQVAALLGAALSLKALYLKKGRPTLFPLSHKTYILLLIICLSLMLTGAGAFAFDFPF